MSAHKDNRAAKPGSIALGLGFLAGMFAPVWLFDIDMDTNLFVTVSVFVGSPFAGGALGWGLEWLGIRLLGRTVVTWVNISLLLVLLATAGGWGGYVLSGGNVVAASLGGLCLAVTNCFLFYFAHAYLFGEAEAAEEEVPPDPIEATRRAPLWQRLVAIISCMVLVLVGLLFVVRQEVATESGVVVRGTGAIIVGLCVMLLGAAFFGVALYYEFRARK